MRIKCVHLDSAMLADPAWAKLARAGLDIHPLAEFASKARPIPSRGVLFKGRGN